MSAGELFFPHAPPALRAEPISDGLALTFPMDVHVVREDRMPFQLSIRAIVRHGGMEVGTAHDTNVYTYGKQTGALVARLPSHVVHGIESVRAGGAAVFDLHVQPDLYRVCPHDEGWLVLRPESQPEPKVIRVSYHKELWAQMLNATGFGENLVVEIPLPPSPPPPWDKVWTLLGQAKAAFLVGDNDTANTAVITKCRQALEAWRDVEEEKRGDGWPSPTVEQRRARTMKERIDVLRWDIHQIAHDVVHYASDSPTRADAVLVLSTLTSLLAKRRP
jgi:hypothetical protein